jgi:hypothetical protein
VPYDFLMQGFSLQIFLPDGKPEGLRIVTRSHWTGVALVVSRAEYLLAKDRIEFQSTGVYALVGPSENDPATREIYIGEGDVVHARILSHLANQDFWTEVIVFTKSDGTLNKAHVRHLEAELVSKARTAKRFLVRNGNSPSPPTPDESTRADLSSFLDDMLVIYRLLGVDAFDLPQDRLDQKVDENLSFTLGGCNGIGRRINDGFIVQSGSRGSRTEKVGLALGYHTIRESLMSNGVLVDKGNQLEFSQDYVFSTSSTAGAILYGGQVSGPQKWKYANGETLKARDQRIAKELGATQVPYDST